MKYSTKNKELGIELKAAVQRLEENLEANAPPIIIEDLARICLYKFARIAGYDLRQELVKPIRHNLDNSTHVKLDIEAFNEFTGHDITYNYY